ncbi:thermonuclease family protein [Mesorhizobium marinum]|uniref:Thermonuclease family protein n=1 Tax=Mesorhizobium marinum TaxID=3228790 RepID=A0ABV3R5U5_9HYPH
MRAIIPPAVALGLAAALVLAGGRMVAGPPDVDPVVLDQPTVEDLVALGEPVGVTPTEPGRVADIAAADRGVPPDDLPEPPSAGKESVASQAPSNPAVPPGDDAPAAEPAKPTAASRLVAPAIVAPPDLSADDLQRDAPREPLSQLSLALPPKPEIRNEWAGTSFFRPLAIESAVFESGGRTIAISGVKSVPVDERCNHDGASWPCGMRARTAFRLWLRGRALVCQLPDEEHEVTRARCRLAKQDAGAWLVSNGWAFAAPGGPYVQAEEKARAAEMGIFGAPPDASSISSVPDAPVSAPLDDLQIMTEGGAEPQPSDPRLAFPPPPPAP